MTRLENDENDVKEFFKVFFYDILIIKSLIEKKPPSIDELFLEIDYDTLMERMNMEKFRKFVKITSDRMNADGIVKTNEVEYKVELNVKKLFKVTSFVKFTKISVPIIDWVRRKMSNTKRLDERREDIVAFASYAPVSAGSLRMNIYRGELRNVPVGEIEDYLKKLVHMGLLKKLGVSNRYVPR